MTILFTGFVSIVDSLGQVGIKLGLVTNLCSGLPLYNQGLGWVVPAFMGMFLGVVIKVSREKLMGNENLRKVS